MPFAEGQSTPLVWGSVDGRFAVTFPPEALRELVEHTRRAGNLETGGILVGRYNDDLNRATVTEVVGPPPDSSAWRTGFLRGVGGLARRLRDLWNSRGRSYYLGEWHFHPSAIPRASPDDEHQMLQIAGDKDYRCPEPILVIVGGGPAHSWTLTAYVFTALGERVSLTDVGSGVDLQR